MDLSGVFIPAVTPFREDTGEIDIPAFQSNLRHWSQHPIQGVVIAGTTGEAVLLDREERLACATELADAAGAELVHHIGKVFVLFRAREEA